MPTQGFVTILDYSLEKSTTSLNVQDVSAVNFGSVTQDLDEVKDAILTVTKGTVLVAGLTKTYPEATTPPTDPSAQRESKWLVTSQDTCQFLDAGNTIANPGYQKLFTNEIACAKVTDANGAFLKAGSDEADLEHTTIAAFVTAWQANVRSPWNGGANAPTIKVLKMTLVGRSN